MFGIALNVLREHRAGIIREKKLDYSQFMSLISGQTDNMSAPENTAHNKDIADILIRAMAKLTVKQRQALELVYIQGFSQAEGAKIAGCTSWVFYSRLYNAKKRLTRLLSHLKT
jgi:RNA polymerase sigma factor (sigma-70 family)